MRTVTLHNNQGGHDKLYEVQIHPLAEGNLFSVRVVWGRNPGNQRLLIGASSQVRMTGVLLAAALREMRHVVAEKVSRGYRVIRTTDLEDEPVVRVSQPVRPERFYVPPTPAPARLARQAPAPRPAAPAVEDDCGPALAVAVASVRAEDFWRR